MTIGKWTTEKIASLTKRAEEIARDLKIPEDKAWELMRACDTQRVLETVERMERRQERIAQAEMRSLAARAATLKSNLESDK